MAQHGDSEEPAGLEAPEVDDELEDPEEEDQHEDGGILRRASERLREYWQRRPHLEKTGRTLTLIELEVARIERQRALDRELSEGSAEPGIGERGPGLSGKAMAIYSVLGLLIIGVPLAIVIQRLTATDLGPPPKRDAESMLPVEEEWITDQSARELAETFLKARSIEERLAVVRQPERVRIWLPSAPEEVSAHPIPFARLWPMGPASANGEARFQRFAVEMADGGTRLLCVVQTPRGPLVDYEAFARHSSTDWDRLLTGSPADELRVFARSSTYYQRAFEDELKWKAFQLTSPDWPGELTGYAPAGSATAGTLLAILSQTGKQRVTLRVRSDGDSHLTRQVIIEKVLASGWVRTEGDLESRWLLQGRPEPGD